MGEYWCVFILDLKVMTKPFRIYPNPGAPKSWDQPVLPLTGAKCKAAAVPSRDGQLR